MSLLYSNYLFNQFSYSSLKDDIKYLGLSLSRRVSYVHMVRGLSLSSVVMTCVSYGIKIHLLRKFYFPSLRQCTQQQMI